MLTILKCGDHLVSTGTIYGGTVNLWAVTFKRFGIEVTFVDASASEEELDKAFRPNTKAVFGETIANPAIAVLDIEKLAKVAHKHNVPLIVDNTFATPVSVSYTHLDVYKRQNAFCSLPISSLRLLPTGFSPDLYCSMSRCKRTMGRT